MGLAILVKAAIVAVAVVVGVWCGMWLRQMLRAPAFVYAARLCTRRGRVGTRTYWRKAVNNFVYIRETADDDRVVRKIEMWCPHLREELLRGFSSPIGGEWLKQEGAQSFIVRRERLAFLGRNYDNVDVRIDVSPVFGSRIVASRPGEPS